MRRHPSRRRFLGQTAAITTGFWLGAEPSVRADKSPSERLNVAFIAAGGRASENIKNIRSLGENIVAFCDVDDERAAKNYNAHPNVPRFRDFRKMLDTVKGIDAVVVSTPDHTHAPASVTAMRMGKHVYCEKPLTHSVWEARLMRETAEKGKLATQMGNVGTGFSGFRRGVEVLRSGAIGAVHTVHVWTDRPGKYWRQGLDTPTDRPAPPTTLDWDLWLGPAPYRPYHRVYAPHDWRGWFDFGCGSLGDMGCHTANLPYMGLDPGSPNSVAAETSERKPDCFPAWSVVTYEFPSRGGHPPVKLIWYDGGKLPPDDVLAAVMPPRDDKAPSAKDAPAPKPPRSGCLLIGTKGMLYSPDDYGVTQRLLPAEKFADYQPPEPSLPRGTGSFMTWHYREWVEACKGGPKPLANFDYAARLTEAVLLGNVAIRTGKQITWDAAAMKAVGCPEADAYLKPEFRKGWEL
jgi:predicted dehydrogenase